MITDWRTAEHIAAAWVRRFGWADAEVTEDGRDSGIDVRAKGAVAQVKCWNHKRAGIADVQRLAGSAKPGQSCLFFSTHGYTGPARVWCYHPDHRVALFELLPDGGLVADNRHAWRIVREAPFRLPFAIRTPRLRSARRVYVGAGLFLLLDFGFLLYFVVLALMRGALTTSEGMGFTFQIALADLGCLIGAVHALRPEARRFVQANRRYRETRSWVDWRQAFRFEIDDRDAGTPPDLFVGYELHWFLRLEFFWQDLGWWWRYVRRWAVSQTRRSQ